MSERKIDLDKNFLSNKDELEIIYDGPSFDGQMEISRLTSQLKSTEHLIKELVSEYYNQRGFKEEPEVNIYLKLKRGSFEEIISIILNKEIIQDVLSGCITALFTYYIMNRNKKKEERQIPKTQINIENIVNNIKIAQYIKHLSDPLEKEGDKIKIVSKRNPQFNTEISFDDKSLFRDRLTELESEIKIEYFEEEFFGKLRAVDLDKEKYRFSLEGGETAVPVEFKDKIDSEVIRRILDKRIKIKAVATKKNDELEMLKILHFEEKKIKTLGDFKG
ncbi:MAG: hypothetical protein AABW80_01750 [Nanoarchaeota archaeon]